MLVGVLDCATGEIAFVNAGHENPLVVRADGTVETLAVRGGPPFCVVDFPFTLEVRQLIPKGTDLSDASQTWLNDVAALMNSRPGKTLGWKTPTPAEAMAAFNEAVALAI